MSPEYTSGREIVTHITSPRDHPDDVTYARRECSVFLRPGEGDPALLRGYSSRESDRMGVFSFESV